MNTSDDSNHRAERQQAERLCGTAVESLQAVLMARDAVRAHAAEHRKSGSPWIDGELVLAHLDAAIRLAKWNGLRDAA